MQTASNLVKRHKDITLLFLKHAQLAAIPADHENSLNGSQAAELASDLEHLGPTFTRVAQLFLGRPDLLPENYLNALIHLRDHRMPGDYAEAEAFETIENIVEDELGKKLARIFRTFDPEPYAFVGISQLHRATLPDGKEVTVKIQRPKLRQQRVKDLDSLAEIGGFLDQNTSLGQRYQFAEGMDQFRAEMMAELDFRREANHLAELGRNTGSYRQIALPLAIDELTSSRVLTTNRLEGRKISDLPEQTDSESEGEAAADDLVGSYTQQLVAVGQFHGNPHTANHWLTPDNSVAIAELGAICRLSAHTKSQVGVFLSALCEGHAVRAIDAAIRLSNSSRNEINRPALLDAFHSSPQNEPVCLGSRVLTVCAIFARSGVLLPPEIAMMGKMWINLQQICEKLSPGFDMEFSLQQHLTELMRERDQVILRFPERLTSAI